MTTPIHIGLHWPTGPQLVQWAVGLAGLVLPNVGALPEAWTHQAPWLAPAVTLAAGGVLLLARKPGAPSPQQLGALVSTLVEQRASLPPPTTPAAQARALAGAVPEVDQEAPTTPGAR